MEFRIKYSGVGHKYTQDEIDLVAEVMQTADPLTQGKYRDDFEKGFAQYLGVDHAFTMNNATSALEIAAQLCQFKDGDEIICPSHTFTASLYPFLKKGAKVKWADIDIETRVVTAETIGAKITDKTKAIIVVHLYGYMANVEPIRKLANEHSLFLIEDNAQALGTEKNGKKAGSFGDFSVFSFHSHKNITTLGEGGMLVVKDPLHASLVPLLRHNGHKPFEFEQKHYWLPAMGDVDFPTLNGEMLWPNNFCLGEIECALGNKLINRLDELNNFRRMRAIEFIDHFSVYPNIQFHREDSLRHNYHQLIAFFPHGQRDNFMMKMVYQKKIKCIVPYFPLNHNSLYKKAGFEDFDGKNADFFFNNMCSIPFQSWMSDDDFQYTIESTIDVMKNLIK
jgi:dTDP-4-amino-4,6-dideoxygalactose transaminase